MMNNNKNLQKRVMRRVYGIWFLRQIGPILLLEMPVLLAVGLWEIARTFFVARIFEDFIISVHSGSILTIANFIGSALYSSTHLLPLAVIGFLSVLSLILGYRLLRNFMQMTLVRI